MNFLLKPPTNNTPKPTQRSILRKKLWYEWKQSPRPRPKTKELKETFAFVSRTERLLKHKKLIIDAAGGHGALGMAFKLHQNNIEKIIIGDLHCPESFATLKRAWFPLESSTSATNNEEKKTSSTFIEHPNPTSFIEHRKIDLRDRGWLIKLLKSENIDPTECGVVGCHVCNALSDELIDECLNAKVEFCIMGCCHGSTSKQGKAIKQSAKELGVSLGMLVDTARFGIIAQREGYIAKIRTIDESITPENRILIGLYDDGDSAAHTKIALDKVAVVYDRVFSSTDEKRLTLKD